jgi:hypothetical protein
MAEVLRVGQAELRTQIFYHIGRAFDPPGWQGRLVEEESQRKGIRSQVPREQKCSNMARPYDSKAIK